MTISKNYTRIIPNKRGALLGANIRKGNDRSSESQQKRDDRNILNSVQVREQNLIFHF